jgi:biopolymer transport protein ExbB/TolQ
MTDRLAEAGAESQEAAIRSSSMGILGSPLLWGAALTAGFYAVLPYLPAQRELLQRYFCGHWLEYVETGLFFLGLAMLARTGLGISAERASLARDPLADAGVADALDPVERAETIEGALQNLPGRLRGTHLVERLRDVCAFIRGRRSAESLEEHLKYLAEQAEARTFENYGLLRTITWAIPILGFLGTVVGITIAIANVTPEQLDTSLPAVTGGLAVAFDTTALALGLSLVLVFAAFVVNRAESRVLMQVEDYGTKRLLVLFPPSSSAGGALDAIERQAAETLLARTESLSNWQTDLWQDALEGMRERWTETLSAQQSRLEATLRAGMAATLDDHTRQLATIRGEFLQAFESVSRHLRDDLAESRQAGREAQEAFCFQLDALWQRVRAELGGLREAEAQRLDALAGTVSESATHWREQLEACTQAARDQAIALEHQTDTLERLVGTKSELVGVEQRLTQNLEAVRAAETFEQTLHSLNAAVHLLTARTTSKAA